MWKVDHILALFAPFDCLSCGQEGLLLCRGCQVLGIAPPPGACYKCALPCASAVCEGCVTATVLASAWSATTYQGVAQRLIGRLKFNRTQSAAAIIAAIIHSRVPSLHSNTVVVHVPTANQRVRQRGYDQAQLIARELARLRGLPYQALLRRRGHTRQVGANRLERLRQLQTAYHCPYPKRVAGKRVLLVDDVLTTGATLETAARVLKQSGARSVAAAVFAQKL